MWTRTEGARERGDRAERRAEDYLRKQGLQLLERNYRCKAGEIDLVMRDGPSDVFVEVRYRKSTRYGSPAESVTPNKQMRLRRAAEHYLQRRRGSAAPCRFDVLSITGVGPAAQIDWIPDAF